MTDFISKSTPRHLLISGVGRSGTTILVQYFTLLGMDTGFTEEEALNNVDLISHAGLEFNDLCNDDELPYLIKAPSLCDTLEDALESKCVVVRGIIIPIRKLADAAASRKRVHDEAKRLGLDPLTHLGSIWGDSDYDDQEKYLAEKLYNLVHVVTKYSIPKYFVEFPKFVYDHGYLYDCLEPLLSMHEISYNESADAHSQVVNPSLIHKF